MPVSPLVLIDPRLRGLPVLLGFLCLIVVEYGVSLLAHRNAYDLRETAATMGIAAGRILMRGTGAIFIAAPSKDETLRFGVVNAAPSFNPFCIVFGEWIAIARDVWVAPDARQKFNALFRVPAVPSSRSIASPVLVASPPSILHFWRLRMSRFSFILTSLCAISGLVMLINIWMEAAPAHAQMSEEMRARTRAIKEACHGDYERLCSGVLPRGHRVVSCLREHAGSLSPDCAQGLTEAKAYKDRANGAADLAQ